MIINSDKLLTELTSLVKNQIAYSKTLLERSENELQFRMQEKSWSVLECIEHLNFYGDFYLPEITKRMKYSNSNSDINFKSGFLGNKFSMDMLPKEKMKTMNTFKSKNPLNSNLEKEKVLHKFINQQEEMLILLKMAKNKNLNKIKTSITLPLLKFKLGDTFRFVIYHIERHLKQAENVLKNYR